MPEKTFVQINYNYFRSFGYEENSVEDKIYHLLCKEFEKYPNKDKIKAVPINLIYEKLRRSYQQEKIDQGLKNLKKGKANNPIISITEKEILPTKYFGILL